MAPHDVAAAPRPGGTGWRHVVADGRDGRSLVGIGYEHDEEALLALVAALARGHRPRRREGRSRGGSPLEGRRRVPLAGRSASRSRAEAAARSKTDEAAELAAAAGASPTDYLAADDLTPEPVDVNTAPAAELEKLPGMSRSRARRAVKEREAQGGFTSVEDFGEAVGLQPHEIVRLRKLAACSPRPRGERRFGRRVDY